MREIGIGVLVLGALMLLIHGILNVSGNALLLIGMLACVIGTVLYVYFNKAEDRK